MNHFGFDSVSDAYGPMVGNQYDIVKRVWNGEDVRSYDIHHTTMNWLVMKKFVTVDKDCRLQLAKP